MWASVQLYASATVPPGNNPSTQWIWGGVGPSLDILECGNIFFVYREVPRTYPVESHLDAAPLFVHRNLWHYIEDGGKSKHQIDRIHPCVR
jgi:hypothetical protein